MFLHILKEYKYPQHAFLEMQLLKDKFLCTGCHDSVMQQTSESASESKKMHIHIRNDINGP